MEKAFKISSITHHNDHTSAVGKVYLWDMTGRIDRGEFRQSGFREVISTLPIEFEDFRTEAQVTQVVRKLAARIRPRLKLIEAQRD